MYFALAVLVNHVQTIRAENWKDTKQKRFPKAKVCSFPPPKKKKPSNLIFHSTESKSYKAITFHIYSREKSKQNKMQNKKKAISKKKKLSKSFQLPHWKYGNKNILPNEGKWYLET